METQRSQPGSATAVGIIPARLGSTRFPRKVLADKTGKPLLQHVWEAASRCTSLSRLVIAADDQQVIDAAHLFGAEAVLTRTDHPNGTSRLAEAARLLDLPLNQIVVNVQGDEPELEPAAVAAAVTSLVAGEASFNARVGTAASAFSPGDDPANPNIVKLVSARDGRALYFSRALIPHRRDPGNTTAAQPLRHVGIYAYRREFLQLYPTLAPTPLETTEQLEQLRVLEHGFAIAVGLCPPTAPGIDTHEQYEAFVQRWRAAHQG